MPIAVHTVMTGVTGTPWYSTFIYDTADPADVGQAHASSSAFWSSIAPLMTDQVTLTVDGLVDILSADGGTIIDQVSETPFVTQGEDATDALPFATQAFINWNTGVRMGGRQIRGRTYVPGLTEGRNGPNGLITPGTMAIIQAQADALVGPLSPGLLIRSRTHNQVFSVTGATVPQKWAVLRSRRD